MGEETGWEDLAPAPPGDRLVVDIEGFEGPLDLLLTLARGQKVDLAKISILELVEQYLSFIAEARRVALELAADYLVMAAWLAYLKSRLLLPIEENEEEPSGEELAARLQFQLLRLEAMRERSAQLMSRNRQGRDVFRRGMPEGVRLIRHSKYELSFYELLQAYAAQQRRREKSSYRVVRQPVYTMEELLHRLEPLMGKAHDWTTLETFLPAEAREPRRRRSAMAASFAAMLEMTRQGKIELRQAAPFTPIYIRRRSDGGEQA
jgi:segregation and condensation protein A